MAKTGGQLRGQLFGRPAFRHSGTLLKIPGQKALALLSYLAAVPGAHERAELVRLLWENGNLNYLRQLLAKLNRTFGRPDWLEITSETVSLHAGSDRADFLSALDRECYGDALRNWNAAGETVNLQSHFLHGLAAPTVRYEEWLEEERWRLASLHAEALLAHAIGLEAAGNIAEAIALHSQLTEQDPFNETAHRSIMRLEHSRGNLQAALRQMDAFTRILRTEFDGLANPLPETRELAVLIERELSGQSVESAAAMALPQPVTPFVGRSAEVEAVRKIMRRSDCRLLTLFGPGGSGKTRLALEVARLEGRRHAQGTCFASLEAVDGPAFLIPAIAGPLGLKLAGSESPERQLADWLAGREMLILLDNFEHLLAHEAAVDMLGFLVGATPSCRWLVTSRERLGLTSEHLYHVPGLAFPEKADEPGHGEFGAVTLFSLTARRVRPGFRLLAADMAPLLEFCNIVDGLPLAIILAASWVQALPVAGIVEEFKRDPAFLKSDLRDLAERHRRLEWIVASSLDRLAGPEKKILVRLSVFHGDFGAEAAREIAGAPLHGLLRLMNRSLLSSDQPGRFRLHGLIRQLTARRLDASGEATAIRALHTSRYMNLAEDLFPQAHGTGAGDYIHTVSTEYGNFAAALAELADAGQADRGVTLCTYLAPFWGMTGRHRDGIHWLKRFLPAVEAAGLRARAQSSLGIFLRGIADYAASDLAHEKARDIFGELGRRIDYAAELGHLAVNARARSRFQKGSALYEEALGIARNGEEPRLLGNLLNNYAVLEESRGHYQAALTLHEEGLRLRRKIGHAQGIAHSLANIGQVLHRLGRVEEGLEEKLKALALTEEIGDNVNRGELLVSVAWSHTDLGRFDEAEAALQTAHDLALKHGNRRALYYVHSNRALLARAQGNWSAAVTWYREALVLQHEAGELLQVAISLEGLAVLAAEHANWSFTAFCLGAAEAIRLELDRPADLDEQQWFDETKARMTAEIGMAALARELERGRTTLLPAAINAALQDEVLTPGRS